MTTQRLGQGTFLEAVVGRDRWRQAQLSGLSDSVSGGQEVVWPDLLFKTRAHFGSPEPSSGPWSLGLCDAQGLYVVLSDSGMVP